MVWPCFAESPVSYLFFKEEDLGEREASWLVGSKNAGEKKILPVKILVFLAVKLIFCP